MGSYDLIVQSVLIAQGIEFKLQKRKKLKIFFTCLFQQASTKKNGCFKIDEKIYPLVENYACHHQRAQTGQVVSKAENITEF